MSYKKQSTMDDIFEICSLLPWWFGASAAVIIYFIAHHYAVTEIVRSESMGQLAADNIKKSFAGYAQYIIPAFCVAGSLASFFKRRRK